jgi:hypothetical protein
MWCTQPVLLVSLNKSVGMETAAAQLMAYNEDNWNGI